MISVPFDRSKLLEPFCLWEVSKFPKPFIYNANILLYFFITMSLFNSSSVKKTSKQCIMNKHGTCSVEKLL